MVASLNSSAARGFARKREATRNQSESFGDRSVEVCEAIIIGQHSGSHVVRPGEHTEIRLTLAAHRDVSDLTVGFEISDELGEIVFGTNTFLLGKSQSVSTGERYEIVFSFPANLKHGQYSVGAALHTGSTHEDCCFRWCDTLCAFEVVDSTAADFVGYCRLTPEVQWSSC